MVAPVWSRPARGASSAALPSPRASTAGVSALAAAAWLLSGEEDRFSTMRSLLSRGSLLCGGRRSMGVWLARGAAVVVAPAGLLVGRVRAAQGLAAADLVLDPRFELVLLCRRSRDLFGHVLGNAHHALFVADHDVARVDRDLGAADRDVDVRGVVLREVGERARALRIH